MKTKKNILKEKAMDWRKGEVLKAARTVFVRKGFHRSTMDDVAREMGVSKGALYLCFDSKENLFMALVDQSITGRHDIVRQILASEMSSLAKIRAYVEHTFEYFESNRDLLGMFMMLERDLLCSDLHKEVHEKITTMMIQVMDTLTAIMKQGIKEKVLKRGDPEQMATALGGIVQMFIMRAIFDESKKSTKKDVEFIMTAFLDGVKKEKTN